jgi:tripartite-type tricarboxylate transporter receptor subunit TctC
MFHPRIALKGLFIVACLLLTIGWVEQAGSQTKYPTRSIDMICGYAPGGQTDVTTRIIGEFLKKKWGVSLNVINKPGGATVPASLEVYRAKPDGYTLFIDGTSSNVTLEMSIKDLPFKVMDRTFICMHSIAPYVITVTAASPYKTLKDLFDDLKKDPDHFTFISGGALATHDIIFRQACKVLGVDPSKSKPIVTRGAAESAILTAGGSVKFGGGSVGSQLTAIQAGTVRPLAVCGPERWSQFPNVPSTAELGYPSIRADQWTGVSGPPKTPAYVVEAWEKAIQEMAKDQETISKLANVAAKLHYVGSADFRNLVTSYHAELKSLWEVQ